MRVRSAWNQPRDIHSERTAGTLVIATLLANHLMNKPKTERYNKLTEAIHQRLHDYRDAVNELDPARPLKSVTFRVLPVEAGGRRREIRFSVRHASSK